MNMQFVATTPPSRVAPKSPAAQPVPGPAAGDTYYQIALELLQITDQFELMRTALIHAVNMTEQERGEPLDLAFALMRASARRIQEVSIRSQLMLRGDDIDDCVTVYGENR